MNKYARMLITDRRDSRRSRDYATYNDGRRDYTDYGRDSHYEYDDRRERRDYGDYRRDMDYRGDYGRERDMNRDYRRRDYGEPELFTQKDMETWKSLMKNEDGTRGEHFRAEQVKDACRAAGIDIEEFGDGVFCLAMNMMYSDYCKVAKKYGVDKPEYYADLAKAFLRDKDFDGKPEEKLYLYYKAIVEKDG